MPFVPTSLSPDEQKILEDNLTPEDIKRCNKNAIAAFLVLGQRQSVIKKLEVNRLMKTGHRFHKINNAMIISASHDIFKTLGMRLFEFDDKFIIVNSNIDHSKFIKHKPEAEEEMVVLFFTLIAIFTSCEEKTSEPDLMSALQNLDIKEQDLLKILATLTKKTYLIKRAENDEQMYSWGSRAVAETDPANFFHCFLEIAGGKEEDWPEQKRRIELLKKIHGTNSRVVASGSNSQR